MKKLQRPGYTARNAFEECISRVRNADLKSRLSACTDLIVAAETEFDQKITTGNIYTIAKELIVNRNVFASELEKVYTSRMVDKNGPGRGIYDKLISAPSLGICPLCNHRDVQTLDHYLPKVDFPRLTVTPVNLIPACFPCNKGKLTTTPSNSQEETLHPYYDDVDNDEWIFATVNRSNPVSLSFHAAPPNHWRKLLRSRAVHHFSSFSLNEIYSIQAAVLLRNLIARLTKIHDAKGFEGVSDYLAEEANSRFKVDKNSWQTVFYRTLSLDRWFCEGGFKNQHVG